MNVRFSLGIDLGTSNSAIAVADLESDQTRIVEITQFLCPGTMPGSPRSSASSPASMARSCLTAW